MYHHLQCAGATIDILCTQYNSCTVEQQFEILVFPMGKLNLEKPTNSFQSNPLSKDNLEFIHLSDFICLSETLNSLYTLSELPKKAAKYIDAI